ncbi:MAG: hypothetical protein ACK53X_08615 [Holosporales bacterium]
MRRDINDALLRDGKHKNYPFIKELEEPLAELPISSLQMKKEPLCYYRWLVADVFVGHHNQRLNR